MALPVGATALTAPASGAGAVQTRSHSSLLLRERVSSAGVFDVSVSVESAAKASGVVDLQFGSGARRVTRVTPGQRTVVHVRVPIRGRSLVIRAFAERAMPDFSVTLLRVAPSTPAVLGSWGALIGLYPGFFGTGAGSGAGVT
ncbi:MAG: hypothetical protein ABSB73_12925, partial [Solirubrobacteraceae bacterium]